MPEVIASWFDLVVCSGWTVSAIRIVAMSRTSWVLPFARIFWGWEKEKLWSWFEGYPPGEANHRHWSSPARCGVIENKSLIKLWRGFGFGSVNLMHRQLPKAYLHVNFRMMRSAGEESFYGNLRWVFSKNKISRKVQAIMIERKFCHECIPTNKEKYEDHVIGTFMLRRSLDRSLLEWHWVIKYTIRNLFCLFANSMQNYSRSTCYGQSRPSSKHRLSSCSLSAIVALVHCKKKGRK